MQLAHQFRSRAILQLIKGVFRVLQKLLRYFNGTIISTSSELLLPFSPVILSLILNELVIALAGVNSRILPLALSTVSLDIT